MINRRVQLQMPGDLARRYKSKSQQARVVSEAWDAKSFLCDCDSLHSMALRKQSGD